MRTCVLKSPTFTEFQDSLRAETGPLMWVPASAEQLEAKGPGYQGTWQNIEFWVADAVTDDATDYTGAMYGPEAFRYTEGPVGKVLPQIDRRIASLSPYWLQTELRDNLAFSGAIFSDDLTMGALAEAGSVPERARQSLAAGADMALICNDPEAAARTIAELPADTEPASHGRLAAMRPRKIDWAQGQLQAGSQWQARVTELQAALARPVLALDG